jgi:hypothetical protein
MDSAIGSAAVCSAVAVLVTGSALLRSVVGLAFGLCSRHWNYRNWLGCGMLGCSSLGYRLGFTTLCCGLGYRAV